MKTAYSQYNLMKFHVLHILKDKKWWWWKDIYDALPSEPKPPEESFQRYMRRLHKYGEYYILIKRKKGKLVEETIYTKRTYVQKKRYKKSVMYKISASGLQIYSKLRNSPTLKI